MQPACQGSSCQSVYSESGSCNSSVCKFTIIVLVRGIVKRCHLAAIIII